MKTPDGVAAEACPCATGSPKLSRAAKLALQYIGADWQKVPHSIRASHVAVLIRQGHVEHRWPFDLHARMASGSVPWLREGEIRRKPNLKNAIDNQSEVSDSALNGPPQ